MSGEEIISNETRGDSCSSRNNCGSQRKLILIVCHEDSLAGGAGLSMLDWVERGMDSQYEIEILLPYELSASPTLSSYCCRKKIPYRKCCYIRESYRTNNEKTHLSSLRLTASRIARKKYAKTIYSGCVKRVARRYHDRKIAIVISNSLATCFGADLAIELNAAHIWYVRERLDVVGLESPFDPERISSLEKRSWAVFVSEAVFQDSKRSFEHSRCRIINDYVKEEKTVTSHRKFLEGGVCRIISVGALVANKRHADEIRAVAALVKEGYSIEFDIYGEGPEKTNLSKLISDLGCESQITLKGYANDLSEIRMNYDIALSASEYESFGRSNVEALYYENLLIAASGGNTKYLIADGATGLLFAPGDISKIALLIQYAILNRGEAKRIISRARQEALSRYAKPINLKLIDFFEVVVENC